MSDRKPKITIQDVTAFVACVTAYYFLVNRIVLHGSLALDAPYLKDILSSESIAPPVERATVLIIFMSMCVPFVVFMSSYIHRVGVQRYFELFMLRVRYSKAMFGILVCFLIVLLGTVFGARESIILSFVLSFFVSFGICVWGQFDVLAGFSVSMLCTLVFLLGCLFASVENKNLGASENARFEILKSIDQVVGADIESMYRIGDAVCLTTKNATYVIPWSNIGAIKK